MAYDQITALTGGWPGFELVDVQRDESTTPPSITLRLIPVAGRPKRCSNCGDVVATVHDVSERRIRDLPILDATTWLVFPKARVDCPRCGPTVEAVVWLDRYQRMTVRFAESIARLAQMLPIQHVAQYFRVHWHTVKEIDRRSLERKLGRMEDHLEGLRQLAIDEFAIEKGHRYVTVVFDMLAHRIVWLARGRDETALAGFFEAMGPARCAQIEAVALDMWRAYTKQVTHYCPHAALVYDAFHIIAKYGLEVVDRVRVDETNRIARASGQGGSIRDARRVIKGTRWLLLRNGAGLAKAERVRLRELLRANRALFIVYVLKDDLKQLWKYRAPHAAKRWWAHWRRRATASRLAPLQRFVAMMDRHLDGILHHCKYPLHTGVLEGCNNKIKVIKRMAYGYRDDAYFLLKIRAAFPGIPR